MTKEPPVATRAECWMCSYCPVLASGKRGPAAEGMLTVQIGTPNLTLHTHPRGEPLARGAKPARPIDHGFYAEMGDYVVQALRPAGDIDGGQNPAFDAAFLYPGQVLPPHLTRRRHAQPQRYSYEEEEDEWDALLSWFGLGESHDGGVATERDALPAPKRAGFPPIPNPVESTSYPVTHRPVTHRPERRDSADAPPPAVRPDPPPPPPRVDPFARLPPTYSGPGGTHPRLVDQSPPANDHLRPAERDRATWATNVISGDSPGGVVRWTYRPGDDPGGGGGGDDDGVRSGDLDRPGVRPVNDKQTDSAPAVDAAARRRLEKLRALFGDDSDGDDGDLFNVEPDVTSPGTKNEILTKGVIHKVEDLCTTDDATVGDSPADDNREPKETVLPENVPENVPEKVVKAATDAPATLVDVAKASIAQDVASMKRTKDEARAELESLRARLKVLEASLVDGDTTAVFSAGDTAGVSGDATDASKPTASKVGEATAATPPPPAVAVEALD